MSRTVYRPTASRWQRFAVGCDDDEWIPLFLGLLVSGGFFFGAGAAMVTDRVTIAWLCMAGIAGLVFAAVFAICIYVVLVQDRLAVTVQHDMTGILLGACMTVWQELPADMRDHTRPVIDAAFVLAQLPQGSEAELTRRLAVLKQIRDEVAERATAGTLTAVGTDDIDRAEALLAVLREQRGAVNTPPALPPAGALSRLAQRPVPAPVAWLVKKAQEGTR
jgi:hypothetical protein